MENEGEKFEAVAVRDGRIVATGTSEEILRISTEDVIDLKGKTVLPGFIDTHQHILSYTEGLQSVNLRETKSFDEAKNKIIERVMDTPSGKWIKGVKFNHEDWDFPILPSKKELDEISTEHPILISRYCMHVHVANSMALSLAGIDKNFKPSAEGSVEVDQNGEPTGVLWENAVTPLLEIIPDPLGTYEDKKNAVKEVLKDMSSYGITGVTPIQGKFCDAMEYIGMYQDLEKENSLPVRIYVSFDEYPVFGMKSGFGSDMIKYGFYKIYSDGSLGSRAAKLFEPYYDMPNATGVLNYSQEDINEMVRKAYDMNLQIGIHAIGDKGLDIALNAIENVYYKNPKPDYRFRLIHVMVLNENLIERLKSLPVVLDIQPKFVSSNVKWSEQRLGKERAKLSYPWRRLIDEGLVLTGGSDSPVEPYNPMLGVYAVVTRKNLEGYPPQGYYPAQRVTVYEALSMYTKNAAYASFEENIKGSIAVGKLADFIILDRDPFVVECDCLKDIVVEKTYLAGRDVYTRS
ncbi:amidohydrolase [Alkalibaculum sporogenes]|nr:amidohydrolase [Alkalibaculum sporogenes]